jgi:hypothetical protein
MSVENKQIPSDWLAEFEAAAQRPLKERWRYAFIKTYKPVMDDADFRAFDTMEEYRRWCAENLPRWLGYARPEYPQADEIREGVEAPQKSGGRKS